jgi:TolB-like protein
MFDRKARISCIILFLLFFSGFAAPSMATGAAGEAGSVIVAILPFAMNTPASLIYLQNGLRDMLSSRLSWQGKVEVVDKFKTNSAAKGTKEISQNEALLIGAALKVDYVLYGSITSTGQSLSIDAKMAPVSGKTAPVSFYAQAKNLDDVIPQVNLLAQQINQKVFGKSEEKTQSVSAEAEELATRNPELLLREAATSADKTSADKTSADKTSTEKTSAEKKSTDKTSAEKKSFFNRKFGKVNPEGPQNQSDFWKSQDLQGGILGMDVGDVDGDGQDEIVAVQAKRLIVYKKEKEGLRAVGSFDGTPADSFLWVSVAGTHGENKPYIYLTNLRTGSASGQSADVYSYVLAFSGGKVQVVAEGIPYYLNTVYLGQRGKVLVGQKRGEKDQGPFGGGIFEMQLRDNALVPGPEVTTPSGAHLNVFNFAKADIRNYKVDEFIQVDDRFTPHILDASGKQVWIGDGVWGATTNSFESKIGDRLWRKAAYYAIPSPILIADLRHNGASEVVVNRNTGSSERWLANSRKYFSLGEIVALSWGRKGLTEENWKTNELNGQVTSLRIGSLDGKDKNQLVVSVVYAKDVYKLKEARSVIFAYDLNAK